MKLNDMGNGWYSLQVQMMRSNSAGCDRGWVALVTGLDPKYGLARTFVPHTPKPQDNSDAIGEYGPLEPGRAYEYRNIAEDGQSLYGYVKHGGQSGFFRIEEGGVLVVMTKMEVLAMSKPSSAGLSGGTELNSKANEDERCPGSSGIKTR